jgi:hypothetical protein
MLNIDGLYVKQGSWVSAPNRRSWEADQDPTRVQFAEAKAQANATESRETAAFSVVYRRQS